MTQPINSNPAPTPAPPPEASEQSVSGHRPLIITTADLRSGTFTTLEILDTLETPIIPLLQGIMKTPVPSIPIPNFRGLREGNPIETDLEITSNAAEVIAASIRAFASPSRRPTINGDDQGGFMILLLDSTLLSHLDNHNDSITVATNPLVYEDSGDLSKRETTERAALAVVLLLRGGLETATIEGIQTRLGAGVGCTNDQISRYADEHNSTSWSEAQSGCDDFQTDNPSFTDWALGTDAGSQINNTSPQDPLSTLADAFERVGLSYEYASGLNFSVIALEAMEQDGESFDWRPLLGTVALGALKFGLPYAQAASQTGDMPDIPLAYQDEVRSIRASEVSQTMSGSDIGYTVASVVLPYGEALYTDNPDVMRFNQKFNIMFAFGRRDGLPTALAETREAAGTAGNQLARGGHVGLAGLEAATFTMGGLTYGIAMREGSTLEQIVMSGLSLLALGHLIGTSAQLAHEQHDGREMIHAYVTLGGFALGAGLGAAAPKSKVLRTISSLGVQPIYTDGPSSSFASLPGLDNSSRLPQIDGIGLSYSGRLGLTRRQQAVRDFDAEEMDRSTEEFLIGQERLAAHQRAEVEYAAERAREQDGLADSVGN